ncbi:GntR family transcriptional regulator [Salinibacterium sp. M195]|nr:GntR family transcriptional regulator [Salinibacterium sp. M195]
MNNLVDQNISEKVANEVREAIHDGSLSPGERLVERTLAARLGVSHIPVREALAKLAEEGLVERTPRRGARVAALSQEELAEISTLRIVLEQFVCHRAQAMWSDKIEGRLRKIVDSMIAAAEAGDVDRMFALDRRFHEELWEIADHKLLLSIASQLRGRINGFLRAANGALTPDDLVAHAMSHNDLIAALASGDPEQASKAMASHIEIAADRIDTVGTTIEK